MNTKISNLKEELKKIAVEIKEVKIETKKIQKQYGYAGNLQYSILKLKRKFRNKHIVYCLLKGRKYEEIECKVRDGNEPNWTIIKKIQEEYSETTQNVCPC